METRARQHAAQLESLNAAVIATVEGCSEEQWRRPSVEAGRSVAVVAHHVAEVQQAIARLLAALAAGETWTPTVGTEEIEANNARHAVEHAGVGKTETVDLLRTHGAAIAATLRRLGDDDLARHAGAFAGNELNVEQVVEWIVIGHTADHLASIEASLAA